MVTKTIARDLSVTLSGWRLDNPVIPASGTFGFGNEFRDFYDINILAPSRSRVRRATRASAIRRPVSPSARRG